MEKVLFDPGYSSCLLGVSENAAFMYNAFQTSEMPYKQKKFQYSMLFPNIKALLHKNIAFYLGCLLWAVYISSFDAEIENNPCLNGEFNKEDSLEETTYLIYLLEGAINRDSKYFLNKPYEADSRYLSVLKMYNEFLLLNEGFINVKSTLDIKLPSSLKKPDADELNKIKATIDEAVSKSDLAKLFEVYELIL